MSDREAPPDPSDGGPSRRSAATPATTGWDTGSFWVPTPDAKGLFLAGVVVFFVLHFDELFGLHTSAALVFGWLPVNFAYHISMGLVHVGFVLVLYRYWPGDPDPPGTEDGTSDPPGTEDGP